MRKPKPTQEKELTSKYDPYENKICNKSMSQEECELAILQEAVYENEEILDEIEKEKVVIDETITRIFEILEAYIIKKNLLLYGGFAINAILPEYAKFYDPKHEIPDYDIYSPTPLEDAIDLVDVFFENGFKDVETRAGVHYMTYKIFVNSITVADLTILDKSIFDNLQREAIVINRIHYCPVNFLRRNIYKELSQPKGDIQRWEKIYKRLNKINQSFPVDVSIDCKSIEFQRKMDSVETTEGEEIYEIVKSAFIHLGVVFLGGYACSLYSQYMPVSSRKIIEEIPDFEVLYDDIAKGSQLVKERLQMAGFKRVKIIHHEMVDEIIPESYEIQVNNDTVAFIYKPNACYSYNIVNLNKQHIKVASIDTMMFFCYTFYYSSEPYHSRDKNMCIIKALFKVEEENRLNQKGLLKRFSIECIGNQKNLAEIKEEKTKKFKELFNKRHTREYSVWFLKYNPLFQPRPAFMRHRDKYKKVRFSLKKPRYRYLPTSVPVLRREEEIDDLSESSEPNTSGNQSDFSSKQPTSSYGRFSENKKVRKTRKGRRNKGVRFILQNNRANYHKPKKGSKYDTLSESQRMDRYDTLSKKPFESQRSEKYGILSESPMESQRSENSYDTLIDTPTENSYDTLSHTPTENSYHTLSDTPFTSQIQSEYSATDKRKYHNISTHRGKPFKKRYTRYNKPQIIDSMELYRENQNQKQKQKQKQKNHKIKKATSEYNQEENKRKMDSLKEILGFKDEGKTKNGVFTPFPLL